MNRYSTTGTRVVESKEVRRSTVYPEIAPSEEDYYVITSTGDRFDILAKEFYGDQTYWWAIASANPNVRRDSLNIDPGVQLRIPPLRTILESYEQLNRSR
jgi:nucleoid-associated protein YgaU